MDKIISEPALKVDNLQPNADFHATASAVDDRQGGWLWCQACQGMFYPRGGNGLCPATMAPGYVTPNPARGGHNPRGSGSYFQLRSTTATPQQQPGWSWCSKCCGLFFAGGGDFGVCPSGGDHTNAGSGQYAAIIGETGDGQQGGWFWCAQCMGMFFGGLNGGCCPKNLGAHDSDGSGNYACLHV